MSLTLDDAQRVLAAALAKGDELGVKVSIAVLDARGDLKLAARPDGAPHFSPDIARGKAQVSATFGAPSSGFADPGALKPILDQISGMTGGRMVFFQGAVPLMKDGQLVGAVGGSGASSQRKWTFLGSRATSSGVNASAATRPA